MKVPGRGQLAERRIEAFNQQMQEVLSGGEELEFFKKLLREFASENACSTEDAGAALAYLLQRKRPLQPPPDDLRPPKQPRPQRETARKPRAARARQSDLQSYRIQVGRDHNVTPGHIVGAIANEIGLDSSRIGRIQLFAAHSTVDLPKGMPPHVLQHLQKVRIFQRPLALQLDNGQPAGNTEAVAAGPTVDRKQTRFDGRSPGRPGGNKPNRFSKPTQNRTKRTGKPRGPNKNKGQAQGKAGR
jgi:ATP-dependent RNA helicase DeaD